jgi:SdrD B-like domain
MIGRRRHRAWPALVPILLLGGGAGRDAACAQTAQALPAQPEYQDRYIDGGTLVPELISGTETTDAGDGLARSLRMDGVVSLLGSDNGGLSSNTSEHGLVANAAWDTAQYGTWTLDASGRTGGSNELRSGRSQGGLFALRQRGMPFDGGWRADNSIGHVNTTQVSLARAQQRFYLPTAPIQGVSTEWRAPGLQVVGSVGEPGQFGGVVVPNFRTLDGMVGSLGAQWSPDASWTIATQWVNARNADLGTTSLFATPVLQSAHTGMISARRETSRVQGQLTMLNGKIDGQPGGSGAWLDVTLPRGASQQSMGAFYIQPNLNWGTQQIANDLQGGYYRYSLHRPRWLADVGLDAVGSVSGRGGKTLYMTANMRYQQSRLVGFGGVSNVSRTNGDASYRLQGYVDRLNGRGTATTQLGFSRDSRGSIGSLAVSQNWEMQAGNYLNTAIAAERSAFDAGSGFGTGGTVISATIAGGGQLASRWGFQGNLRLARNVQGSGAPGLSSNMSITWQATQSWMTLLSFYESRMGSWRRVDVNSPLTAPGSLVVPSTQDRGLFLTVRYQRASGLHFAPLGGAPGAGSGSLSGYIFLDANQNGRKDADEPGAEHITVVLDQKYSVTTDVTGRYEFIAVAAGTHTVEAVMDNLPLPWSFANQGPHTVAIRTRGRTIFDLAATRMR